MANVLHRAVKALSSTLQRAASYCVDIRRGGSTYASKLHGTLTSKEYQVFDAEMLPWKKTVSDWILPKCKISRTIEAGDQIVCGETVYSVQPIGNRPCVEPHDDLGVMVIVHTEEQPRE